MSGRREQWEDMKQRVLQSVVSATEYGKDEVGGNTMVGDRHKVCNTIVASVAEELLAGGMAVWMDIVVKGVDMDAESPEGGDVDIYGRKMVTRRRSDYSGDTGRRRASDT